MISRARWRAASAVPYSPSLNLLRSISVSGMADQRRRELVLSVSYLQGCVPAEPATGEGKRACGFFRCSTTNGSASRVRMRIDEAQQAQQQQLKLLLRLLQQLVAACATTSTKNHRTLLHKKKLFAAPKAAHALPEKSQAIGPILIDMHVEERV